MYARSIGSVPNVTYTCPTTTNSRKSTSPVLGVRCVSATHCSTTDGVIAVVTAAAMTSERVLRSSFLKCQRNLFLAPVYANLSSGFKKSGAGSRENKGRIGLPSSTNYCPAIATEQHSFRAKLLHVDISPAP